MTLPLQLDSTSFKKLSNPSKSTSRQVLTKITGLALGGRSNYALKMKSHKLMYPHNQEFLSCKNPFLRVNRKCPAHSLSLFPGLVKIDRRTASSGSSVGILAREAVVVVRQTNRRRDDAGHSSEAMRGGAGAGRVPAPGCGSRRGAGRGGGDDRRADSLLPHCARDL